MEKNQQLIPWNIKRWPGVPGAGGTEVWQLRGESAAQPGHHLPRPRGPVQLSPPRTCRVIPAPAMWGFLQSSSTWPGVLSPSIASDESRAPLCVSSHYFISFPPATR